jgi:outer membrane receptor protein involved in Fe transport
MKTLPFCCLLLGLCFARPASAQLQVGYFAPWLTNVGGTVGYAFAWKDGAQHQLQVLPQLSYFSQLQVSSNVMLHPELVYRRGGAERRFYWSSSVGAGYLLSLQRQDGTVDLGSGDLTHRTVSLHHFVPSVGLGLGLAPRKRLGYYLKASYGRSFRANAENAAFYGLSAGLVFQLQPQE